MNYVYDKTIEAIYEWNLQYGCISIIELDNYIIVQFSTGGWSENETAARILNNIYSIYDDGGHYVVCINKYTLKKEDIDILKIQAGILYKKKKKFIYKFIRGD